MRSCPICQTDYPEGVEVCARDGSALVALAPAPASVHDAPTFPAFPAFPVSPALPAFPAVAAASAPITVPAPAVKATFSPVATNLSLPGLSSQVPRRAGPALPAEVVAVEAVAPAAATSETFDSLVGATLAGRYLIIRRIGEGGMGAVYEARHTIIGKRVAVKVLLEKFLTKSDFVARLLQEARLASAIGHEHIVDVTDFGTTDDGRAFVAMEFLEGESLAQLVMREAPLPVERSLRITRQVASALGAAHAKGIVHRDVKPENVYLIRRGDADFVKVVDFGISKAVKQGQGDDTPDYHLTHTGLLLGTPLYMSPEQARGDEDLDHRVDVWAMGVMLYECLTGEVPFRANNYLGIISQVLTHTALPPSKLRPELGIPEAVEAVVMRAMAKDRNQRYSLISDVEHDLERLLAGDQNVGGPVRGVPATAPPLQNPARGRVWVWGAALAALIVGVVMVLARPEAIAEAPGAPLAPALPTEVAPRPAPATTPATPRAPALRPLSPEASPESSPEFKIRASEATRAAGGEPAASSRRIDLARKKSGSVRIPSARRESNGSVAAAAAAAAAAAGDRSRAALPSSPHRPTTKSDDPVIRGVLPSRSGEGYPDN